MKKVFKFALLTLALCCSFQVVKAQNVMKEGAIKYEFIKMEPESPEAAMLAGSQMNIYFNGEQQKVEVNMMGGMMKFDVLMKEDGKSGVMLMDMMGQKMKINMDEEQIKKQESEGKVSADDLDITYDKGDTKEIAGYKCYKANIKPKDSEDVIQLYVTDELNANAKSMEKRFPGLKGFPLEFSMGGQGVMMTFAAVAVEKTVDNAVFNVPSEGYQEMTMEEFQKQFGGMAGGFGF